MAKPKKPIIAIMYDFDKTLSTKDMQEYGFIPKLGVTSSEFWTDVDTLKKKENMDPVLAYLRVMLKKASEKGVSVTRDEFVSLGKDVEYFKGVEDWFERINAYGKANGVNVEHYVISSGIKEIIEGSSIGKYFKKIYACEFLYDENNVAVWPKLAVNYTNKTQFLFRINKGVLDICDDESLNAYTPEEDRRIPFRNMIYIGDGLTDVPCMKLVKLNRGQSIAVFANRRKTVANKLLNENRVDFITEANYTKDSELDKIVKTIIEKMSVVEKLARLHDKHKKIYKRITYKGRKMDIKNQLEQFAKEKCSCDKSHNIVIPKIIVKSGAMLDLPAILKDYGVKKAQIIADVNTFAVAGEKVVEILKLNNFKYSLYVFGSKELESDEKAIGSAIMHFDNSCDIVISVGSGVINDIGKIVANVSKLPYVIVGTAPSMDGYASATSSMSMDGLKVSLPSKCADVIIGDIEILKNAPMKTLQAGLGDMLAKYVSIAEWRIANEITGEYYCERVAELIRMALKRCVDNAKGLLNRDENAVKAVFEGLVIGGIAMAFAGVSRPASGVEHYFSHVWDMRGLEFGVKVDLHGIQCAIGTNIASGLYEKVLKINPNKEKALNYAKNFDFNAWAKELKEFLGSGANAMIAQEEKEGKYNLEKHAKRLDIIISKWDKICEIIRTEIPTQKQIQDILDVIGAPKTAKEVGIDCDLFTTFKATKDIRDKYVLSRLVWDLGVIDEIF